MKTEKIAMSVAEAVVALSLGRTNIYQELSAGRLQALKCGKRTLITTESAERWLASLESYNAPPSQEDRP